MSNSHDHPLLGFLPPKLRNELLDLAQARTDDNVTPQQWQQRARVLADRATSMPPPIRDAFNRLINHYAQLERMEDSRTQSEIEELDAPVNTLSSTLSQETSLESRQEARTVNHTRELTTELSVQPSPKE